MNNFTKIPLRPTIDVVDWQDVVTWWEKVDHCGSSCTSWGESNANNAQHRETRSATSIFLGRSVLFEFNRRTNTSPSRQLQQHVQRLLLSDYLCSFFDTSRGLIVTKWYKMNNWNINITIKIKSHTCAAVFISHAKTIRIIPRRWFSRRRLFECCCQTDWWNDRPCRIRRRAIGSVCRCRCQWVVNVEVGRPLTMVDVR